MARSTRRSEATWSSAPLLLVCVLVGCGPATPSVDHADRESTTPPAPSRPASSSTEDDPRGLPADATFTQLLDIARGLDRRRDTASDDGCILGGGGDAWRLAADLAPAIRPLPEADDDLDTRLAAGVSAVTVLTRWGALGAGQAEGLSLSAVTTTLPSASTSARVWFVTDRGLYERSTDGTVGAVEPGGPPSTEDISSLFIAAEAGVPLSRLAEVLALAPRSLAGHIGLAVTLAEGTRLPDAPDPPALDSAPLCPEGLPALAEETAYGALSAEHLRSRLGPLRERATICVSTASGPGAAGGRFEVVMRIDATGAVTDACVQSNSADDPALRACLVRALRDLRFDAPSPAGVLDVALPLVLSPAATQRQAPLCD